MMAMITPVYVENVGQLFGSNQLQRNRYHIFKKAYNKELKRSPAGLEGQYPGRLGSQL